MSTGASRGTLIFLYLYNVFKRSCFVLQIGAGIQVPPNSSKILKKYGILEDVSRAVQPHDIAIHSYKDSSVLLKQILDLAIQQIYDALYLVTHRAGYLKALAKEAKELGVTIQWGRPSRASTSPRHRSFWRMARHGRLF